MVIGATGGIGSETARLCAAEGARLTCVGRSVEALQALADELALGPDRSLYLTGDMTDPAQVAALAPRVQERFGSVDAIVLALGAGMLKPFDKTEVEILDRLYAVNVRAPFLILQAMMPLLNKQQARVICLSGILGVRTMPNSAAYAASKHGVVGLFRALQKEYMRSNTSFTLLSTCGVDTGFWRDIASKPPAASLLTARQVASEIVHILGQDPKLTAQEVILQRTDHQLL